VLARIRQEIAAHGGWISFARYMELALQAYYGGTVAFDAEGDFVTAPELGSLFGRTLARQLAQLQPQSILEFGGGSGALAEVLLDELGCDYAILETSPTLRAKQQARLGKRARWIDSLPERFRGVMLANEVVDAMPVHVVSWTERGIVEGGLSENGWSDRPASGALLEAAKEIEVAPPYQSEINLAARAWIGSLAERLEQGAIFIIDYGFPRREYYHPQRASGTLMCHHRHRSHADVFNNPGGEDITAHVDFSALADVAAEAGLRILGYATQAQFLVNCGITEVLGEANVENALRYAPIAAEAQKLLSPAEMGELFKVFALGRGVAASLVGFSHGERSHTL